MMPVPKRPIRPIALAAALSLSPLLAHAQAWIKPGDENLILRFGALTERYDTSVRIDGDTSGGTNINLEGDGGLAQDKSTFMLGATWRFAKKHRLDGLYDENKRSASKTTERSFTIGDTVVPAGTVLSTEQKTAIGYVGYRYSFMKTDGAEVAAGLGLYGGNFKFNFNANNPVINIDKSTTLPLPVLVLTGDFYLSDRMTLTATLRGLKLKIGDVDGSVLQAGLQGEYLLTNNFGIGAALEHFDMSVDVTKSGFRGTTDLTANSGRLYLTARF